MKYLALLLLAMAMQAASVERRLQHAEIRKAAQKAIAYAMSQESKLTAQDIATLIELDKRFRLKLDRGRLLQLMAARSPIRKTPFWRFVDENYVASESEVKGMKGNDRITASALYCDLYVLPWDFYQQLEAMAEAADFDATRAFLAIGLLKQRGCRFDTARVDPVAQRLRLTLQRIAADKDAPEILQIEAVLFLTLGGFRSDVRPAWVRRLISLQQPDGRFGRTPYSTLLTARMLLEYGQP
jgi:hypothetical protein